MMEVAGQAVGDELAQGAGELYAGRAPADQDNGEDPLVGQLGMGVDVLEGGEDVIAQPHRVGKGLQGKRMLMDSGDPEIGRGRTSGQDQIVVRQVLLIVEMDHAPVEVEVQDRRHAHPDVGPAVEQCPDGPGDVIGAEPCGRHLVQQRPEPVVVVPVHHGDLERAP